MPGDILLCHFDQSPPIDSSGNGIVLTNAGGGVLSASNPYFGSGSWFWDYLAHGYVTAADGRLVLSTDDFGVSFAFRNEVPPNAQTYLFDSRLSGDTSTGFGLFIDSTNGLLTLYDGAANYPAPGVLVNDLNWHFVQCQRFQGQFGMVVDGQLRMTMQMPQNKSSNTITLGAAQYTPQGVAAFSGYLDEFKITKNISKLPRNASSTFANFTRLLKG